MSQKIWCFLGVHKYGEEKDRKIVCQECGKISIVPCVHNFKLYATRDIKSVYTNNTIGHLTEDRCANCGEIKETRSYIE